MRWREEEWLQYDVSDFQDILSSCKYAKNLILEGILHIIFGIEILWTKAMIHSFIQQAHTIKEIVFFKKSYVNVELSRLQLQILFFGNMSFFN